MYHSYVQIRVLEPWLCVKIQINHALNSFGWAVDGTASTSDVLFHLFDTTITIVARGQSPVQHVMMLLTFSRGFKDIITKTAKFKEFPCLENKFQNSRGFKEIKDTWEPCIGYWPYIVEDTKCVGQLLQSFTRRLSLAVYVEFSLAIFYLLHCTVYEKNNSNTIPYRGILHLHVQNEFLHRVRGCLIRSQSQNPVAFSIFLTTRKRDVRHDKM